MTTEDISLRMGLERLEIEPIKLTKNIKEDNPFSNTSLKKNSPKTFTQSSKCNCMIQKKKNVSIYKKKMHNKLLREPVLKLSHTNNSLRNECQQLYSKDTSPACISPMFQSDNVCLHTLVDTCNQLSISTKKNQTCIRTNKPNSCVKWWKCETNERPSRDLPSERSSSCSQQALNPPCDITIDELASYFETLVHIPKKMSSMAEMMYI